jgi:DNA (cytosine-5)-methyltransferase 1
VLSVFSGIDLLGLSFEREGYCVVGFLDVVWGRDIRTFHPPASVFEGVIGGPPCQAFSALRYLIRHNGHEPRFGNLIPEYERVVFEAQPAWFLMENVPDAPIPHVEGYQTWACIVRDKWVGGVQPRPRRFSFGTRDGRPLDIEWVALMRPEAGTATLGCDSGIAYEEVRRTQSILADGRRVPVKVGGSGRLRRSVTADSRMGSVGTRVRGGGRVLPHGQGRDRVFAGGNLPGMGSVLPIEDACEAMGLPREFTKEMPFTMQGKRSLIGNGVPVAMGRAIARAVKRAVS